MSKTLPALLLLSLFASLLNSRLFGSPSLTAYFLTAIITLVISILATCYIIRHRKVPFRAIPVYVGFFIIHAGYIGMSGFVTGTTGLTHYYWINSALFLFAFHQLYHNLVVNEQNHHSPNRRLSITSLLYLSIVLLSFIESVVVLLQAAQVIPTVNRFFLATGTWTNPNVTAMFLALTLFATTQSISLIPNKTGRIVLYLSLAVTLMAIVLLQSRTAYIASIIILGGAWWKRITRLFTKSEGLNYKTFLVIIVGVYFIFLFIGLFQSKQASSSARLKVWNNSIDMLLQRPVTGYGFGMFEREYNLFTAQSVRPHNAYIKYAYNDFLELGVEGGLVPMLLWVAMLALLIWHCLKRSNNAISFFPVVVSFAVMQTVNFVFQAIPVMLLFLCYMAMMPGTARKVLTLRSQGRISQRGRLHSVAGCVLISLAFISLYNECRLANAFHRHETVRRYYNKEQAIVAYMSLYPLLKKQASYHEDFGDAFIRIRQFKLALKEYLQASKTSSRPSILTKTGDCYLETGNYEQSEHYYQLVQNINPTQFGPKMSLLRLYERKGDSANALKIAREIMQMPVRVKSTQTDTIKTYAARVIQFNKHIIQ